MSVTRTPLPRISPKINKNKTEDNNVKESPKSITNDPLIVNDHPVINESPQWKVEEKKSDDDDKFNTILLVLKQMKDEIKMGMKR